MSYGKITLNEQTQISSVPGDFKKAAMKLIEERDNLIVLNNILMDKLEMMQFAVGFYAEKTNFTYRVNMEWDGDSFCNDFGTIARECMDRLKEIK